MNIDNNIYMIQNRNNSGSAYYSDKVLPSWDKFGYYINMFDCVYPDTLHEYDYLKFNKYEILNKYSKTLLSRDLTTGEQAGWYSHTLLWIKCAMENKDIAIIEHDVECIAPLEFDKRGLNIFCRYQNNNEWIDYAERFKPHPHWGQRYKIVPFTHAYTLTPDIATQMLNAIQPVCPNGFADDFLLAWQLKDKPLDKVIDSMYNYTKPIFNKAIGGTMSHG